VNFCVLFNDIIYIFLYFTFGTVHTVIQIGYRNNFVTFIWTCYAYFLWNKYI